MHGAVSAGKVHRRDLRGEEEAGFKYLTEMLIDKKER